MTPEEAARRMGAPIHAIAAMREHPAGCVVTTRAGAELLVSDTVVRPYVPEVDDVDDVEPKAAAEPERATEPDAEAADAKPAPRSARKTGGR